MSFQSCNVTKFPIEIMLERVGTQHDVSPPTQPARPLRARASAARPPSPARPPSLCRPLDGLFAKIVTIFPSNHWNNIKNLQCIFNWHMEIWLKLGKSDQNYWNFDLKLWNFNQKWWKIDQNYEDLSKIMEIWSDN